MYKLAMISLLLHIIDYAKITPLASGKLLVALSISFCAFTPILQKLQLCRELCQNPRSQVFHQSLIC